MKKKIASCFDIGEVPRSPGKWNWNWLYFLPFIFTFEQGDQLLLFLLSGTAQVLPKSSRVTSEVLPKLSRMTYMPRRRRTFSSKRRKPLGTFSSNGRGQPIGRLVLDIYPSIYRYVTVF